MSGLVSQVGLEDIAVKTVETGLLPLCIRIAAQRHYRPSVQVVYDGRSG